jgi:hypothetical protein
MRPMYIATWIAFLQTRNIPLRLLEAWLGAHRFSVWRWQHGHDALAPKRQPAFKALLREAFAEMVHTGRPSSGVWMALADWVTRWEEELALHRGDVAGKAALAMQALREGTSYDKPPKTVEDIERLKLHRRAISRWIRMNDPRHSAWEPSGAAARISHNPETRQETMMRFERLWAWHQADATELAAMHREAEAKRWAAELEAIERQREPACAPMRPLP